MSNHQDGPSICVMMASYNGEKYIQEQVNSILKQEGVNVKLVIRDDGSNDNTMRILEKYRNQDGIRIIRGQNLGPANNFYELLQDAFEADYYAWSDQDDIWDEDKLVTAINMISNIEDRPVLYFSASRTVDANNHPVSVIGANTPSINYGMALIRSKAQGATFVFNNALIKIARMYTPDFKCCGIFHDAWLHRVCLAVGGIVVHDPLPHMSYRIHENNVVAKMPTNTLKDRVDRFLAINMPNYYSKVAGQILRGYGELMPADNYKLTYDLANYRKNFRCKLRVVFSLKNKVGVFKEDIKFKMRVILDKA